MQVGCTDPSWFCQGIQSIADDRGNGSLLMGTSTAATEGGHPLAEPHLAKTRPQSSTNRPGVTGLVQEFKESSSALERHQWPLDRLHCTAMTQCCIISDSLQSQNSVKFPISAKVEHLFMFLECLRVTTLKLTVQNAALTSKTLSICWE